MKRASARACCWRSPAANRPRAGSEPGQGRGPGSTVSPPRCPGPRSASGVGDDVDVICRQAETLPATNSAHGSGGDRPFCVWCMMWCMKRTNIYLAEGQAAALDRAARAAGVSRAELIRELIDRAIGGHPGADLAADLAAIDGSFGILAGEDTFTRGRDERMDYLDRLAGA